MSVTEVVFRRSTLTIAALLAKWLLEHVVGGLNDTCGGDDSTLLLLLYAGWMSSSIVCIICDRSWVRKVNEGARFCIFVKLDLLWSWCWILDLECLFFTLLVTRNWVFLINELFVKSRVDILNLIKAWSVAHEAVFSDQMVVLDRTRSDFLEWLSYRRLSWIVMLLFLLSLIDLLHFVGLHQDWIFIILDSDIDLILANSDWSFLLRFLDDLRLLQCCLHSSSSHYLCLVFLHCFHQNHSTCNLGRINYTIAAVWVG